MTRATNLVYPLRYAIKGVKVLSLSLIFQKCFQRWNGISISSIYNSKFNIIIKCYKDVHLCKVGR